MSITALQTGIAGINNGLAGMRRNASDIARGGELSDTTRTLVDLRANQRQVEASVKVVEAADAMLGSLLDVRA